MSGQEDDHSVEARLAEFQRNIVAALDGKVLAEVASRAGLEVGEVSDLVSGAVQADLYVLARLETALGVSLWPRASPPQK